MGSLGTLFICLVLLASGLAIGFLFIKTAIKAALKEHDREKNN